MLRRLLALDLSPPHTRKTHSKPRRAIAFALIFFMTFTSMPTNLLYGGFFISNDSQLSSLPHALASESSTPVLGTNDVEEIEEIFSSPIRFETEDGKLIDIAQRDKNAKVRSPRGMQKWNSSGKRVSNLGKSYSSVDALLRKVGR